MKYSVIIPHNNSLDTLPRLFDSIPRRDDIEIILVDNSHIPISKRNVGIEREYKLLHSEENRYAGGARNVGLDNANGDWLIFADADDFFTSSAFDVFDKYANSNADLVYFKSDSVYDDTLEPSDRHLLFNNYIDKFINGEYSELDCRLAYVVPWGKMIRRDLVVNNRIRFDEVIAANDMFFSTLVGYYSLSFLTDNAQVYVITTRRQSLANRRDLPVVKSRYLVCLRRNEFLKEHGLSDKQGSVMVYFYQASKLGVKHLWWFLKQAFKYKQNLFIGYHNWLHTLVGIKENENINRKYIKFK